MEVELSWYEEEEELVFVVAEPETWPCRNDIRMVRPLPSEGAEAV